MIMGFDLLIILDKLKTAVESDGLTTFHAQESRSHLFKNIRGLKTTTDEIEEALEIACQSHHLTLAQVWMQTKPKFAVKLIGYYHDSVDENLKDYYDASDMLPLIIGEGLSGKTLQTYEPRFCRNINELTDKGLLALLPENTQCSSLVICLRSLVTGDVNYAFEFLWTQNRNYIILLESLLLTLKRCLPSFKLASGAELGTDLQVEDVENSTGRGIGFLKIPQVNRLSQLPKTLEKRRRLIAEDCMSSSEVKCKTNPIPLPQEVAEHQFGPFMNEGSRNLTLSACTSKRTRDVSGNSEWQEPDFVKRELTDECETQIESGQEDSSFVKRHSSVWNRFLENTGHSASNSNSNSSVRYPVDDELIIRAEYGDQGTLLYLPISSTYVDIMKNINEAFNLVPGSYALHYLDDRNQWIMLDDDEDWVNCLMHWRIKGAQTIQVRLQEPTRRYSKILNRNSSPQISKVLKKRSRLVKCISSSEVKSENPLFPLPLADGKHFRRSANEAVGNLTVWQGPNIVKRMLSDLCESQSDSNQEDNEANQKLSAGSNRMWYTGDDELIVNTEYGDHHTVLYVPISSKVADIKKNVDEKYKLDPNTFKLEFLDFEDKWIRLDYDRDWECCIKSSRTAGIQTIRMRVLLKH